MRALMFLVLASCTHDIAVYDRVDVKPARNLDILYVFDDSADRGSYDRMASQIGVLQERLKEIDGQLPNLHVGAVSTDLGTRGTKDVLGPPIVNCAGDGHAGRLVSFNPATGGFRPTGGFLEDVRGPDGTRERNFESEDLALEISRLTNPAAGTANTGCEFEQPLEAMRRALDPRNNPGFVRPNAMLAVVFMTTEDDCSFKTNALLDPNDPALGPLSSFRCTEQGIVCDEPNWREGGVRTNCRPLEGSQLMVDVSEYKTFLEKFKPNAKDVVVSAVAGARTPFEIRTVGVPTLLPSCQGAGGAARPAVRLGSLVDSFGGVMVDGCTQDDAYQQLTTPILNRQRTCFPNLRRDDGEDCDVFEIAAGARTELPRCTDGNTSAACWYTYADANACPDGDNVGIAIRRGNTTAPAGARVEATCFIK
jgi:hypothetical protein